MCCANSFPRPPTRKETLVSPSAIELCVITHVVTTPVWFCVASHENSVAMYMGVSLAVSAETRVHHFRTSLKLRRCCPRGRMWWRKVDMVMGLEAWAEASQQLKL